MKKMNIGQILQEKTYPGRGIMLGRSADGKCAVAAYFIMGRSANSRNRIFVEDGEGIRTEAFDPSKMVDPSLIIYAPVRVLEGQTIVTNGNQTDTIYDGLKAGQTFEQSLRCRRYEPDGPNYTPRISGLIRLLPEGNMEYDLSILKSADGDPASDHRFTFSYGPALPGLGHFISTYVDDGSPIPSFEGEPVPVEVGNDPDETTELIWNSLNEANKVSLFVRYINLEDGTYETRIVNKNH
ncbi:MAG: IMP cyclohydrolase [Lachnospiraceae bacterium]|nr:IMP cyclohydrolase [Lachnospiraceae bacterium]